MNQEEYYNTIYKESALESDRERIDRLKIFFDEAICNKKILDVGCGPGAQVKFLVEQNEVYGVDIARDALKEAQTKGLITRLRIPKY